MQVTKPSLAITSGVKCVAFQKERKGQGLLEVNFVVIGRLHNESENGHSTRSPGLFRSTQWRDELADPTRTNSDLHRGWDVDPAASKPSVR